VPSLYVETRGAGDPLVLVHGFTQSGRAWGRAGELLGQGRRLVLLDAPGHGRSAAVTADLPEGADLMAAAVGEPADWLGYSMGGRFALHVALRQPALVRRLVLVSATAGIDDPAERAERRRSDEGLAERVERDGMEGFVRWWLRQPLFASLPPEAAAVESRLEGTAAGLAASLRRAGTGTQQPLWDRLSSLTMPVLVVVGSADRKYRELGARLVAGVGANAALAVIEGAGHACHMEKPDEFAAAVLSWLGRAG
jgi:2-succinyl-6-hydroxy-2,4-cyclohexadiene-1-carboxylate synthase